MTARTIARSVVTVAAVAGAAATAAAQARGPNPNAPKLMVAACRTPDKALAIQCADKVRSTLEGDVSYRALYVRPKSDVENTLTQSGYDPAVALNPSDAVALAKQLAADLWVDATLEKTATGYKLSANAVLQRDPNMVQPLGSWENAKLDGVMGGLSKAFQDAFNKTFDHQKNCFSLARERKYADAQREINDGIKDYPNSTWLRYCQMQLNKDQKASDDAKIKLGEEIRKIDPNSKGALQDLSILYDAKGDKGKKVEVLMALQKADPGNATLATQIANEIAGMGDLAQARVIVEKLVAENAGDLNLVRTYWLILGGLKDYKKALEVGDEMARLDSSAADSAYYSRSMGYAVAAADTAKAIDILKRAGQKFPKIIEFPRNRLALARRMNNTAEANNAAAAVLKINPKEPGIRASFVKGFLDAAQFDSAIAIGRELKANGDAAETVAGVAVQTGNTMRTHLDTLKAKGADAATMKEATERTFAVTAWADSLATGTSLAPQGKFIMGVVALSVGQIALTEAGDIVTKASNELRAMKPVPDAAKQKAALDKAYGEACPLVKKANEYFTIASGAVPAGGRFNPQAAQQVMGSLQTLNGYVEKMNAGYHCK